MTPHMRLEDLHRRLERASWIVPRGHREEWRAEWIAELSYVYADDPTSASVLAEGLLPDAVMVRRIYVQQRYEAIDWSSPELCIRSLGIGFALLVIATMAQSESRHLVFSRWGWGAFSCFVVLALFSIPSTMVTSRYGAYESYSGDAATLVQRWIRWRYLASKLILMVLSCYLLAVHVTQPFQHLLGVQADWVLMACGLLFNVIAVSWAFTDQLQRCPTCMRYLRSPARMGPPSWSLLDSNATEEICDRGHGLLHQPEWQTSWFEDARWLQLDSSWRELFKP